MIKVLFWQERGKFSFCSAVSGCVNTNQFKVVFGGGTRLRCNPSKWSDPSVKRLSPTRTWKRTKNCWVDPDEGRTSELIRLLWRSSSSLEVEPKFSSMFPSWTFVWTLIFTSCCCLKLNRRLHGCRSGRCRGQTRVGGPTPDPAEDRWKCPWARH